MRVSNWLMDGSEFVAALETRTHRRVARAQEILDGHLADGVTVLGEGFHLLQLWVVLPVVAPSHTLPLTFRNRADSIAARAASLKTNAP